MSEKTKNHPFEELNEEQRAISIPYFVHEGEMYRVERLNKRWFVSFLIVLFMLFITNLGWVIYENQFETFSYEIQQDSGEGGNNTYAGNTVRMAGGNLYGETSGEINNTAAGEDFQPISAETMP